MAGFEPARLARLCLSRTAVLPVHPHLPVKEGERFELSQAAARQFSRLLLYQLSEPSTGAPGVEPGQKVLETFRLSATSRSFDAEGRIRTSDWSPVPAVLQTAAFPLGHLSAHMYYFADE